MAMPAALSCPVFLLLQMRGVIQTQKTKTMTSTGMDEETAKIIAGDITDEELKRFQNMRSMSELRGKATYLFDQYNNDPMKEHSTKQAWYTRQAQQIWETAGQLVDKYMKYKSGAVRVKGLDIPTQEILEDIQQQVPEAYAISKEIEKNYGSRRPEVSITIPIEKTDNRDWDNDGVVLEFDEHGNVQKVHFNEHYDYRRPRNLQELANAYKAGKNLSASYIQLLTDHNLITHGSLILNENRPGKQIFTDEIKLISSV